MCKLCTLCIPDDKCGIKFSNRPIRLEKHRSGQIVPEKWRIFFFFFFAEGIREQRFGGLIELRTLHTV